MQVLLLLLFVCTTSSHPIVREVFYDFDDDYATDFESHDYVWTPPPVTTLRPIPARPCGVICQFERQDHYTSSLTGAATGTSSGTDGVFYLVLLLTIALGDPVTKEDTHGPASGVDPSDAAKTPGPASITGEVVQPRQYPATAPCSGVQGWHAILGLLLLGIFAGATRCFCMR